MANIKTLVVAGTVSVAAAIAGGLILKRLQDKNEADQKAAFEKAEADLQAQQAERSAKVKTHNEEILKDLEESEKNSNEINANLDRAYRIEDEVIKIKKKIESARLTGNELTDQELDDMINDLHQHAKSIDEVADANGGYLKKKPVVSRTIRKISDLYDIIENYREYFKEKKEA